MANQSFCWHCGRKLKLPYFAEIKDPIGNIHNVHKVCVNDAKLGFRAMPYEEIESDSVVFKSATLNYENS